MVARAIPDTLAPSYDRCLQLARRHAENFPVASYLLPGALRPHVAAIYAFARIADDFADEPGRTPAERLALLDDWEASLRGSGTARRSPEGADVFAALDYTRETFGLELGPFTDLLSAFRQDVTTCRYETWAAVLDYCRRSANPVGRVVLALFGFRDAERIARSDDVCTALQLTNFWQDLAIDWSRGRLYVPEDLWREHGADLADLDTGRLSAPWQATLAGAAARTRALFDRGRPVCDLVTGRLRWELRATWWGGCRILDRLQQVNFDVVSRRPALHGWDGVVIAWKVARWRATPRFTTPS